MAHNPDIKCRECAHVIGGDCGMCSRTGKYCAWERAWDINPSPGKEPNCGPEGRHFRKTRSLHDLIRSGPKPDNWDKWTDGLIDKR